MNGVGMSVDGLRTLVSQGVAELTFRRRNPKEGWPRDRRMLCTLNRQLLNSLPGKITLNFRVPTHPPPYNPRAYNLVCVWDIFWQDYRMIPAEAVSVLAFNRTITKQEQEEFWTYFVARFQYMSASDKSRFMKNRF